MSRPQPVPREILEKTDAEFARLKTRAESTQDPREREECLKGMAVIIQDIVALLAACLAGTNIFS